MGLYDGMVSHMRAKKKKKVIIQGLGFLACYGSEFIFLKLMNLVDNW
jgi:hypothetical protein